jgi:chromosome segregation and condensation protein ScpB
MKSSVRFGDDKVASFKAASWGREDLHDHDIWYSPDEMDVIVQECQSLVRGSINQVSEPETVRGLELMAPAYRKCHQEIVKTVLEEQMRQRQANKNSTVDPEALAAVAQSASAHRQRMAHVRDMQDAKVVALIEDTVWIFNNNNKTNNTKTSVVPDLFYLANKRAVR